MSCSKSLYMLKHGRNSLWFRLFLSMKMFCYWYTESFVYHATGLYQSFLAFTPLLLYWFINCKEEQQFYFLFFLQMWSTWYSGVLVYDCYCCHLRNRNNKKKNPVLKNMPVENSWTSLCSLAFGCWRLSLVICCPNSLHHFNFLY